MENLYVFKRYGAYKLSKEFLNKGWRLRGLNKLFFKKLQEPGTTARWSAALKAYRIFLVFLFCSIQTQTEYYTKEMCH